MGHMEIILPSRSYVTLGVHSRLLHIGAPTMLAMDLGEAVLEQTKIIEDLFDVVIESSVCGKYSPSHGAYYLILVASAGCFTNLPDCVPAREYRLLRERFEGILILHQYQCTSRTQK